MKNLITAALFVLFGTTAIGQADWKQVGMDFSAINDKVMSVNDNGDVLVFNTDAGNYGHLWLWTAGNHTWVEINGDFNSAQVFSLSAITDGTNFFISYRDEFLYSHVFEVDSYGVLTEMSVGLYSGTFELAMTLYRSKASGTLYLAGVLSNNDEIQILKYDGSQWNNWASGIFYDSGIYPYSISDISGYVNGTDEYIAVCYDDGALNTVTLFQSPVSSPSYVVANGTGPSGLNASSVGIAGDGVGYPIMLTSSFAVSDSIHYFEYNGSGYSTNTGMKFPGYTVQNIGVSYEAGKKRIMVTTNAAAQATNVFEWTGSSFANVHPSNQGIGNFADGTSSFAQRPKDGKPYFLSTYFAVNSAVGVFSLNNLPSFVSIAKNDVCEYGGYFADSIVIEDIDKDSVWISITSDNQAVVADGDIYSGFLYRQPTSLSYEVYVGSSNQAGTANIQIIMHDGVTADTIFQTITTHSSPIIDVSALLSTPICSNDSPFDPTGLVLPIGGVFSGPAIVAGELDPSLFSQGGGVVYYDVIDVNGCFATAEIPVEYFESPILSLQSTLPASCNAADGQATVSVTAGSSNDYFISWSSGDTNVTSVSNLKAKQYQVNIIDTNGCKGFVSLVVPSSDILVSTVPVTPICAGQTNGSIDITVSGANPFSFNWITGETTEDLSNIGAGIYSVLITDNNGCTTTELVNLSNSSPQMSLDTWAYDTGCGESTGSVTVNQVFGGSSPYSFLWSNGVVTQDLLNANAGNYSVTVTDANACQYTENFTISVYDGPSVYMESINNASCNMNDGAINVSIIQYINPIQSISWSNSASTEDISGLIPGTYTITVTEVGGCQAMSTFEILPFKPVTQPICLVTVDSLTTTNLLVWEKTTLTGISHYNIYRETGATNNYPLVGTVSASNESVWNDVNASPLVTSWRYKIKQVDDCGVSSSFSQHHKTMHVTINKGMGSLYNIYWDQYEGINYSTINLYRYDAVNGIAVIATLPSTNTSYTDDPGLDTVDLDYFVGFDIASPCTSNRAQDYNGTRSNRSAGVFDPGNGVTDLSISEKVDINDLINIYPNPSNGQFTIAFGNSLHGQKTIKVLDSRGRIVAYKKTLDPEYNLNLSYLESGIYFIEILNKENRGLKKVIIN